MAFDFSQPRWQADCRELSNDEKDAFLLALEKTFPDLRWAIGSKPTEFNLHERGLLLRGYIYELRLSSGNVEESRNDYPLATASDVREFTAVTLGTTITADTITADAVTATLAQRGERYGEFDEFAAICQQLKNTAHNAPKWAVMPDDCREAVDMILHKIARALNGDPNYSDNWHDIQGYAKLVEKRITVGAK